MNKFDKLFEDITQNVDWKNIKNTQPSNNVKLPAEEVNRMTQQQIEDILTGKSIPMHIINRMSKEELAYILNQVAKNAKAGPETY